MIYFDYIDLVIRLVLLLILAAMSEAAAFKRLWGMSFTIFSIWLTLFRLTAFRGVQLSVGAFGYNGGAKQVMGTLSTGILPVISDMILVIGVCLFYRHVLMHKRLKGVNRKWTSQI